MTLADAYGSDQIRFPLEQAAAGKHYARSRRAANPAGLARHGRTSCRPRQGWGRQIYYERALIRLLAEERGDVVLVDPTLL